MDTFRPFSLTAQFELQLLSSVPQAFLLKAGEQAAGEETWFGTPWAALSCLRPAAPWLCCPARPGEPPGVRAHPVHVHVHQQVLAGVSGVHTGGGAPRDKKGASMPHPQCQSCAYHHHPWLLSVVNIKRKEIYQSIFFLFTLFCCIHNWNVSTLKFPFLIDINLFSAKNDKNLWQESLVLINIV